MCQILQRVCKYFPKRSTVFFYPNMLPYTQWYSPPGRHFALPELSDTWARHWELPNCLSHTLISNVCNFCHPEMSVLFLTAYLHKTHFTSVSSHTPLSALFTSSVYKSVYVYFSLAIEVTQDKRKPWYTVDAWTTWQMLRLKSVLCTLFAWLAVLNLEVGLCVIHKRFQTAAFS